MYGVALMIAIFNDTADRLFLQWIDFMSNHTNLQTQIFTKLSFRILLLLSIFYFTMNKPVS